MKRAFYLRLMLLSGIAVLVCALISAFLFAMRAQRQTEEWLIRLTLAVAEQYPALPGPDARALSETAGGLRVTIVAPDGRVLDDSDTDAAGTENHLNREEIQYAQPRTVILSTRPSQTLDGYFLYASIRAGDGNVLRLAYRNGGWVQSFTVQLPAILLSAVAALILSLPLAGRFSRAVVRPLADVTERLSVGRYEKLSLSGSRYEEIDRIVRSVHDLFSRIGSVRQTLTAEREKADTVLSYMAEGMVLIDREKNILLCNPSAKRFLGCTQDILGKNILNLTRSGDISRALEQALESGQSSIFELSPRDDVTLSVHVSPAPDTEPAPGPGAILLLIDMSAQKELEKQKRAFFSNASHELKTPVTSLLGFAEMLCGGGVPPGEQAQVFERMRAEAARMSELIGDILTVSHLEGGGAPPEPAVFDGAEVIGEAAASLKPLCARCQVHIELEIQPVTLFLNRRQFYELCINLMENAVKYNRPDGRVRVGLRSEAGAAVLRVEDTGIGIPEEYRTRVFERFFRVDAGRGKKTGGTGLGLAIVKHLVSLYHGEITLDSEVGTGTAVTVNLPASESGEKLRL